MPTPKILVTGATGTVGSALVPALLDRGASVRAMVPRPDRRVAGAETAVADLRDPEAITSALAGIDTVFLNSPSSEDAAALQIRFAGLARDQGVRRMVVLSQYGARTDSPVRFLRWHAEVEAYLQELGTEYTVLRPNLYLQALLGFADTIAQGVLAAPVGDAAVSTIDTRDVAEAAATILIGSGHGGHTYTLTGPRAVTHAEIAAALSSATGGDITFHDLAPDHFAAALGGLLPPWQLAGLVEDYAHYARGEAAEVDPSVTDLIGRPARDITDFARDHAEAFSRP